MTGKPFFDVDDAIRIATSVSNPYRNSSPTDVVGWYMERGFDEAQKEIIKQLQEDK